LLLKAKGGRKNRGIPPVLRPKKEGDHHCHASAEGGKGGGEEVSYFYARKKDRSLQLPEPKKIGSYLTSCNVWGSKKKGGGKCQPISQEEKEKKGTKLASIAD